MHAIAAKAVAFAEAMNPSFVTYQQAVVDNARLFASQLEKGGLRIVSGGTDTHLFLVDLRSIGVTGKQAEEALESVGIIVNRNAIPFDLRPPQVASGIRIGTPAVTTRGFGPEQIRHLAQLMVKVITNIGNEQKYREVREEVPILARSFPVPSLGL